MPVGWSISVTDCSRTTRNPNFLKKNNVNGIYAITYTISLVSICVSRDSFPPTEIIMARNPEIVRVSVEPCIETEREVRKYEIIIEAEGAGKVADVLFTALQVGDCRHNYPHIIAWMHSCLIHWSLPLCR